MLKELRRFEAVVRIAFQFSDKETLSLESSHPFEVRGIHPKLPISVRNLFDDGHYSQATLQAFVYIDKQIQILAGEHESGFKLMMKVFPEASPVLKLTQCSTLSERDEQKGYQFLFAGSMLAIRNPRAHEYAIKDDPDTCLDHLAFASHLIRRLEQAGYPVT